MVNTGPSQTVGTEPEDTEDDEAGDDAGDASAAAGQGARAVWPSPSLTPIIHDAAERMAHAELNGLGKRIEKSAENLVRFRAWTREFYGGHIRTVTRIMAPICRAVGADAENVPVFAERLAESAIDQFAQENPRLVYGQWKTTRAGDLVRLIESHIYGDATNGNQPRQSTDGPADSGDHAGSGSVLAATMARLQSADGIQAAKNADGGYGGWYAIIRRGGRGCPRTRDCHPSRYAV
jgi:hypothetical protein